MSETAKSALFTIISELARRQGRQSIQVGATEFKIDPKAKFDSLETAVLELIADVKWQQVWKWIEDARNSGNQNLSYEIVKRRYPAYRSICNSQESCREIVDGDQKISDELFRILRSRNEAAALETPRAGESIPRELSVTPSALAVDDAQKLIDAAAIKDYFKKNKERLSRKLSEDSSLKARRVLGLEITRHVLDSKAVKPDDRVMRQLRKLTHSSLPERTKTNLTKKHDHGQSHRIALNPCQS
jgi:hypothetical protein